jgi:hypothetical protein
MKIEWNKVTPYSKALALALFVALPILAFFWGMYYGELLATIRMTDLRTSGQQAHAVKGQTSFNGDYINTLMGFSIHYPTTWVQHIAPYAVHDEGFPEEILIQPVPGQDRVFLAPRVLEKICYIGAPFIPARYVDISMEGGSLADMRKFTLSRTFMDGKEEAITLGGLPAYMYTEKNPAAGACPDGSHKEPFVMFLVKHGDKVISISTERYYLPEVKEAIMSLRFL